MHRLTPWIGLAGLLLSLLPLLAEPASAQRERIRVDEAPTDAVVLFAETGFRGRFEAFRDDDHRLDDNRIGNDGASSVRVPRGCLVRLFEHYDFEGASVELREDVADLGRTRLGARHASSIQVRCGITRPSPPDLEAQAVDPERQLRERRGALLFAESAYRGRYQFFPVGAVASLEGQSIGDDAVSSVRVARGCRLVLFADEHFRGQADTIDGDLPSMRRASSGPDTASSLTVDCGGGGVTLYTDSLFRGQNETVSRDVADLGRVIGEDRLGSVRVPYGCQATLYEEANFRGRSLQLDRDAPSLVGQAVGPDAASSIRVACKERPRQDDELPYGSGAVLYDRSFFRGQGVPIRQDEARLARTKIGDDRASSIRVAPGCEVRLFRDANFRGRGVLLDRSIDDLDTVRGIGSNALSSIRVQCNAWIDR